MLTKEITTSGKLEKAEMVPPKRGTALVQHESGSHYVMDMH